MPAASAATAGDAGDSAGADATLVVRPPQAPSTESGDGTGTGESAPTRRRRPFVFGGGARKDKDEQAGGDVDGGAEKREAANADDASEADSDDGPSPVGSRRWIRRILHHERFHTLIIGLVLLDLLLVFVDLILAIMTSCTPEAAEAESGTGSGGEANSTETTSGSVKLVSLLVSSGSAAVRSLAEASENATDTASAAIAMCTPQIKESPGLTILEDVMFWLSVTLLVIFAVEVALNIYVSGIRFLFSVVRGVDSAVIYASLFMELYFEFSGTNASGSGGIVVLRIWKMVRAMHAIAHTIDMRNKHIIRAVKQSNTVITACSKQAHSTFQTAKTDFLRGLRKLRSASPALFATGRAGSSVPLPAMGPAECEASNMLIHEAAFLFDTLEVALRHMELTVAKENQMGLEAAVENTGATMEDFSQEVEEGQRLEHDALAPSISLFEPDGPTDIEKPAAAAGR
ncbi:hypothetical protein HK405_003112 [Cladochytrium tenue]|nr:hypothetical protein HK405_003112 [Cladochytrium tenue]